MLESLKNFLSDLSGGDKRQEGFAEDDYRLAAAALLVHVCTVDGDISSAERTRLHDVLKHRFDLDEEGRRRMVEMMWEIVFADGQVDEFEDNIVWRASDLLGISARDRIELRHQVAGRTQ